MVLEDPGQPAGEPTTGWVAAVVAVAVGASGWQQEVVGLGDGDGVDVGVVGVDGRGREQVVEFGG
jgi:hypothetical protein